MRLLNTSEFQLVEFQGTALPHEYAILSHRWGKDEVLYEDVRRADASGLLSKPLTAGKVKVLKACAQAKKDGYTWIWVDSCCIDKSSSSELTEAINSMFRWYQRAQICYVHLADISAHGAEGQGDRVCASDVVQSSWFTRSWTLQELLAPDNVQFYSSEWGHIGSRDELKYEITKATTIDIGVLQGESLMNYSIAQRMSWAYGRNATREEDIAYSLLGIFGVHMPLLYGEGDRAFLRLQEEISRVSNDETIFSWDTTDELQQGPGAFALHPSYFRTCRGMRTAPNSEPAPFAMTNSGLSISLNLVRKSAGAYLGLLNCVHTQQDMPDLLVGFYLRRVHKNTFERMRSGSGDYRWIGSRHDLNFAGMSQQQIFIRRHGTGSVSKLEQESSLKTHIMFSDNESTKSVFETSRVTHIGTWNPEEGSLQIPRDHTGTILVWDLSMGRGVIQLIEIGFDNDRIPCCIMYDSGHVYYRNWINGRRPIYAGIAPDFTSAAGKPTMPIPVHDYNTLGWTKPTQSDARVHPMGRIFNGAWTVKGMESGLRCHLEASAERTSESYSVKLSMVKAKQDDPLKQTWGSALMSFAFQR